MKLNFLPQLQMGYGSYDVGASMMRSSFLSTKSQDQIFTQAKESKIHDSMSPIGLNKRECFDSADHPNTIAVMLYLDETGSMGEIPERLVKKDFTTIMANIIERGSPDVAVCFCGIGDHKSDRAPVQIGQFESADDKLSEWLTRIWLEGNGGGNGGESYPLAWYTAANHTKIDCFEKRGQKGVLITVGNEDFHEDYSASQIKNIFGDKEKVEGNLTAKEMLAAAQKMYHVYHLGLPSSHSMSAWKRLLGENFIDVEDYHDIVKKISEIVLIHTNKYKSETPKQLAGRVTYETEGEDPFPKEQVGDLDQSIVKIGLPDEDML